MTVRIFENLGITTWKCIDKRWMYIDQVLKGPALTKFRNYVLASKDISRDEYGDQWGLGYPEDVCSEDFWGF